MDYNFEQQMSKTKVKTIKREQLAKFAYINSSKMPGEVLRVDWRLALDRRTDSGEMGFR
jgi:hypothetical protein